MASARTLFLATLLLGTIVGTAPAEPAAPPRWHWTVRPTADLGRLDVTLCFESFRPQRLTLRVPTGAALTVAPAQAGRYGLTVEGDGYVPTQSGGDAAARCIEYAVDVAALTQVKDARAERSGRVLLTDPRAWLLAPALWPPDVDARVEFVLPEGLRVSAPWEPAQGNAWRLPLTSLLGQSVVAIGAFEARSLEVAGTRLDVAVLEGPVRASAAGIDRWLTAALEANAALYAGRYPLRRVQVVVEPSRGDGDPVRFGQAHQSGGGAVHLQLSSTARDEDLPGEWVTVHELTHLAMPWVVPADAWFTEGFVTYYQEVLRARAGFLTPEQFWQSLDEGFARGRKNASLRTLADASQTMGEHHAYHRVYWSGAALAFRLDLALRQATGGKRTLDDFLRLLAQPEIRAKLGWRALDLLAAGDQAFGTRVLAPGVAPALASADFPPVDDLYAALGVRVEGGRVTLSDDPAQRALRESIHGKR